MKPKSADNTYAIAEQAVQSMREHGVMPTAHHYEVFLHFHANSIPDIGLAIVAAQSDGRKIDDYLLDTLHDKFIADNALEGQVRQAGEGIAAEMTEVAASLANVRAHAQGFNRQLKNAQDSLAHCEAGDPNVSGVIENLALATDEMAEHTQALEEKLDQTTQEVVALRTQLEAAREEASKDALTGIANRKLFEARLNEYMADHDRGQAAVGLMIADIDHFKNINDTWGHQTGDQVIKFVATVLEKFAPKDSLVARLGGEEFALLIRRQTPAELKSVAQHIRATVEGKKLVRRSTNQDLGRVTISLGLASRVKGEVAESLIERADCALYQAKRMGRNRVEMSEGTQARAA